MHTRKVEANGIEIAYDEVGEGAPLLLVMGIGAQLVHWPDAFVHALADEGFRVIRFDNRDVGESTWLDHLGRPNVLSAVARSLAGLEVHADYDLVDMADDTAGLMDALGIESAHVVGVSMGGMIGQTLALRHGPRVRSLTSVMSSPGGRRYTLGHPKAVRAILRPPGKTREAYVASMISFFETVGGRGFPLDRDEVAERVGLAWDRGPHLEGFARQLTATLKHGNRSAALRFVRTPTLVIHGGDDPLVPLRGGRATARAIPGARLEVIEGMGHSLPAARGLGSSTACAITRAARSARSRPGPPSQSGSATPSERGCSRRRSGGD